MDEHKTEAFRNGWLAHEAADVPVDANPYDKKTQEFSNIQWESGWCARFNALKHGNLQENDDHYMRYPQSQLEGRW